MPCGGHTRIQPKKTVTVEYFGADRVLDEDVDSGEDEDTGGGHHRDTSVDQLVPFLLSNCPANMGRLVSPNPWSHLFFITTTDSETVGLLSPSRFRWGTLSAVLHFSTLPCRQNSPLRRFLALAFRLNVVHLHLSARANRKNHPTTYRFSDPQR